MPQLFRGVPLSESSGNFVRVEGNCCSLEEIPLSSLSLSYSSIAMEKDEPSSLECPDTHCAFCGHMFRGKKDRRALSEREGVLYISGQVSLLGNSIFMEPKFACQKCFGENSSLVWVHLSVLTVAHSV